MRFTAKIQRTIHAPASKVWAALTQPERVQQYFFGARLRTSWQPGTPIVFEGEWEGKAYRDHGTVLKFEPETMLQYDYFSSWSDQEDRPENYQRIAYRLKKQGESTVLTIIQRNIDSLEKKVHSAQNWVGLMDVLKKMLESGA